MKQSNFAKTVHWRRIRDIFIRLMNHEHVVGNFNLNKITCYKIQRGEELIGRRVTSTAGHAPFVYDNSYEVFEAPLTNEPKRFPFTGTFLMLVHNTSFNYWMLIKMFHSIENVTEVVKYKPLGKYTISCSGSRVDITKDEYGAKLNYGGRIFANDQFDAFNTRKKAYHSSRDMMLARNNGYKHHAGNIAGHQEVKKYHHNSNRHHY